MENAITGIFRDRATWSTMLTACANSGVEDQLAAFVDRLLGREPGTIGGAGVVLDQKLDIR